VANCDSSTCRLFVGFSFSSNFGQTWSPSQTLAGPMQIPWLANTSSGRMVGDYMSTSYVGNNAFPVYAEAFMPNPPPQFLEHTFTTQMPAQSFVGPTRPASSAGAIYGARHQWRPVAGVTTSN
jgi:hypothetical protein